MRIVCPACAAAYQVPDDRLAPGRAVRCARCETDWVPIREGEPPPLAAPAPAEPTLAEAPLAETAPEPVEDPVAETGAETPAVAADDRYVTSARGGGWALRIAWGVSVLLLIGGIGGAVMARDRVMRAWPPSARAYAAIGLLPRAAEAHASPNASPHSSPGPAAAEHPHK